MLYCTLPNVLSTRQDFGPPVFNTSKECLPQVNLDGPMWTKHGVQFLKYLKAVGSSLNVCAKEPVQVVNVARLICYADPCASAIVWSETLWDILCKPRMNLKLSSKITSILDMLLNIEVCYSWVPFSLLVVWSSQYLSYPVTCTGHTCYILCQNIYDQY